MKNLDIGALWSFRLGGLWIGLFFGIFLFVFSVNVLLFEDLTSMGLYLIVYLVLVFLFAELYARLSYVNWKYEFTKESVKIERGIIWKKYTSIPYERVQNVDINRGIIARILGFSSLLIQTAGAHYAQTNMALAEGYIPALGIDEAEKAREFLMKRISKKGI